MEREGWYNSSASPAQAALSIRILASAAKHLNRQRCHQTCTSTEETRKSNTVSRFAEDVEQTAVRGIVRF